MTDKKLTDEEIKSSLEVIASTGNCNECKIRNCKWGTCNCSQITANAALDLINRQKSEIKRLQKEVNLVSIQFQDIQERQEESQAEIDKLNAENMLTMSERNAFRTSFYDVLKQLKTVKSEAYKEFAEKLENEINCRTTLSQQQDKNVIHIMHNLLKEMVGEEE